MRTQICILGLFLLGTHEAFQNFLFHSNYDGSRQINRRHLTEAVQHLFNSDDPESLLVTFIEPDMFVWHIGVTDGDNNHIFRKTLINFIPANCSVKSLGSIQRALIKHRPENPLWVFTDAPPADPRQTYDELVEHSQKMGYQIFFVIAGPCYGNNTEAYRVYQDLAVATNGQVFFLEKSEIRVMIEYVQKYRDYPKDIIMSKTVQPDSRDTKFNVTFDNKMGELTMSATGDEPLVTVTDSNGRPVDTTDIIRLSRVTMVKLDGPRGVYQVTVSSKSETHVLVSAATSLTFEHGFSAQPPADFNDTTRLPKPGISHVSIMLHNAEDYLELRSVQILSMENTVLNEEPLNVVNTATTRFYTTEQIAIPDGIFQIAIILYDKSSGTTLTRHGLTPFTMEIAKCHLPVDGGMGLGSFADLKWYYDKDINECRTFSFVGPFGNENRFDSAAECRRECGGAAPPDAPAIDKCQLPMNVVPLEDEERRMSSQWYYDHIRKVCILLTGNRVRADVGSGFESWEQCRRECAPDAPAPVTTPASLSPSVFQRAQPGLAGKCQQQPDPGACWGAFTRWYYDQTVGECRTFNYSGCLGNPNNFHTLEECSTECAAPAPLLPETPALAKCQQPAQAGPCHRAVLSWYYDHSSGRCFAFLYGGCGGNHNRFESEEACRRECTPPAPPTPETPVIGTCEQAVKVGPCYGLIHKWYYNFTTKSCLPFTYGGCDGNDNRFDSQTECDAACGPPRGSSTEPAPTTPDHSEVASTSTTTSTSTEHTPDKQTSKVCRRDDELDAFGRYVASSLRNLDDKVAINAQNEINSILIKYKLRNLKKTSHFSMQNLVPGVGGADADFK